MVMSSLSGKHSNAHKHYEPKSQRCPAKGKAICGELLVVWGVFSFSELLLYYESNLTLISASSWTCNVILIWRHHLRILKAHVKWGLSTVPENYLKECTGECKRTINPVWTPERSHKPEHGMGGAFCVNPLQRKLNGSNDFLIQRHYRFPVSFNVLQILHP